MLGAMSVRVMMRHAADHGVDDAVFLDAMSCIPVSMWSLGQCARVAVAQTVTSLDPVGMSPDEVRRLTLEATNGIIDRHDQALETENRSGGFGHLHRLLPYQDMVIRHWMA